MNRRRRLDQILTDEYLDELEARSIDDIRRMRDDCEEEESGVSFARRVLQGKLDIVRAELERRSDAGSGAAGSMLVGLPDILGDERGGGRAISGHAPRFLVPPDSGESRRAGDRVVDEDSLSRLTERSEEELAEIAERLAEEEHETSQRRRALLDRIDRLKEELTERYKRGTAQVSDVLAAPPSASA